MLGYLARDISATAKAELAHLFDSQASEVRRQPTSSKRWIKPGSPQMPHGFCRRLHARLAALEAHLQPKNLALT